MDSDHRDVKLEIRSKLCGNAQLFGAFPQGDVLRLRLTVPRRVGALSPVFKLKNDNGVVCDLRFEFETLCGASEVYSCKYVCAGVGLFRYDVTFDSECGSVFPAKDAQLTVYSSDFKTPDWIKGGLMYQIFVDRFARGGAVPVRGDAVIEDDWYGGEPEYAEIRGGEVKNNRFFGGTLYGVIEKLDYLASLGVNCIYLCPVFEAYSNHKYDVGDYSKIDEMFGGEEAFDKLISEAGKRGMGVILDGVFNHTGADSVYFNKFGRYGKGGAYNDKNSPYFPWFNFRSYPDDYECWWNIKILPRVNGDEPSYREYMLGENGIVRRYLRRGAAGWRLDVADELLSGFLCGLREAVKAERPDAVIIGEVWEDASNKVAYDQRRSYLQGGQLDGVMNYVMRDAIISFVSGGAAEEFAHTASELYSHYPKCVSDVCMNLLGTHDTARILNVLGAPAPETNKNAELAAFRLSDEQRDKAVSESKIAWTICATIPGVPCIYYGDEAGMEGWGDPFCRRPYPWGRENKALVDFYRKIGTFRKKHKDVYSCGTFAIEYAKRNVLIFSRKTDSDALLTAVNTGSEPFMLKKGYRDAETGKPVARVEPFSAMIIHKKV